MTDLKFKIKATELLEFQILQPKEEFDFKAIEFNIELEHKMDIAQSLLAVICTVSLMSNKNQLGSIMVSNLFFVEDLKEISAQKKYKKKLAFLTDAVNSISISTTRGYLAASTRGTFLHEAILPIVDPRKFETNVGGD